MTARPGRHLSALLLLAVITGASACSAPATPPAAGFPVGDDPGVPAPGRLPAIAVSAPESTPDEAQAHVRALEDTGAFAAVSDDADYRLSYSAAQRLRSADGAVTGASIAVHLRWRRQYLDTFTYRLGAAEAAALPDHLARRLVGDLRTRNALDPGTLHAALQSSDYRRDLSLPERLGPWRRQGVGIFHDPLLGAHVRYRQEDAGAGHIDVFVYPIRARDWGDPGALLEAELASAGEDLRRLGARGVLHEVRLAPVTVASGTTAARASGRQVTGEFADAAYQPFDFHGYVEVRGDKFLKVLATIPRHDAARTDVAAFLRGLTGAIRVPPESSFMARVRRAWSGGQLARAQSTVITTLPTVSLLATSAWAFSAS